MQLAAISSSGICFFSPAIHLATCSELLAHNISGLLLGCALQPDAYVVARVLPYIADWWNVDGICPGFSPFTTCALPPAAGVSDWAGKRGDAFRPQRELNCVSPYILFFKDRLFRHRYGGGDNMLLMLGTDNGIYIPLLVVRHCWPRRRRRCGEGEGRNWGLPVPAAHAGGCIKLRRAHVLSFYSFRLPPAVHVQPAPNIYAQYSGIPLSSVAFQQQPFCGAILPRRRR